LRKLPPLPDTLIRTAEDVLVFHHEQQPMVPRSATIESGHIIRAYVDGWRLAQLRIEEYGRTEREKFADLIVPFKPDTWGEGRALFYWPQLSHYDRPQPDRRKRSDRTRVDALSDERADYDDPAPQEDLPELEES